MVRVGVVVLFFGVAFLLKYAYEHTHIPIAVRLTAVAVGAIEIGVAAIPFAAESEFDDGEVPSDGHRDDFLFAGFPELD